jgi:transposase
MSDTELLPKPTREPGPVRRLEVFTGAGRRRRWTAEQKARIVAESYKSGETVDHFLCRYFGDFLRRFVPKQLLAISSTTHSGYAGQAGSAAS